MNKKSRQSFTESEVWRKAHVLKNEIFELAKTFPSNEKFRMTDQIIRSSRAINSNLAEGHGRYTYKDQLHFCVQARGSLCETYNHLIDALDCTYINEDHLSYFKNKIDEIERMLNGYMAYLRKNL